METNNAESLEISTKNTVINKQNEEINKVPFNNDAGDGFTSNSKTTNR